jgi:hypothetical protein
MIQLNVKQMKYPHFLILKLFLCGVSQNCQMLFFGYLIWDSNPLAKSHYSYFDNVTLYVP